MAISSLDRGVESSTRAKIGLRHLRIDKWWLQPAISVFVLVSFIIYSTFRAFENKYYFVEPLISLFIQLLELSKISIILLNL